MTKKNTLLLSWTLVVLAFFIDWITPTFCKSYSHDCLDILDNVIIMLWISLPFLFFSLVTYFLREETFRSWLHFVYWWVPLSIFLTLITTESGGGGFGPQMSWGKEDTAFVFSALFAVISLILIIVKSWKLKGK